MAAEKAVQRQAGGYVQYDVTKAESCANNLCTAAGAEDADVMGEAFVDHEWSLGWEMKGCGVRGDTPKKDIVGVASRCSRCHGSIRYGTTVFTVPLFMYR